MRIAVRVGDGIAELSRALETQGHEVVPCVEDAQTAASVTSCDVLVVNGAYYTKAVAAALCGTGSKIRWVQFASAGTDPVQRWGFPDDVLLTNAAAAFAPTVAEHAFALLLAGYRRIVHMDRVRSTEEWRRDRFVARLDSVEGTQLAIVGYGHVGRELAVRAKAFAMRPVVVARRPESARDDGLPAWSLEDLAPVLAQADAVVVCVALAAETRNLIGAPELAAMKASAWLVNVARGGVVDESALLAALRERRIAGAALDVFAQEPLALDSPLRALDNVLITPHIAGFGGAAMRARMASMIADNVDRFASGLPLRNVVALRGTAHH